MSSESHGPKVSSCKSEQQISLFENYDSRADSGRPEDQARRYSGLGDSFRERKNYIESKETRVKDKFGGRCAPTIITAVRNAIDGLNRKISEIDLGEPFLSSHNYVSYKFDSSFFRSIDSSTSTLDLSFVDGGNQELLGAPNFSLQFNRIYFNMFQKGQDRRFPKTLPQKIEFFSLTTASSDHGSELIYESELFPLLENHMQFLPQSSDLKFKSNDRRLMLGNSRPDMRRVSSIARRFAEWTVASHIVKNELDSNDVMIMDGTLRTAFPKENSYARSAYAAAKAKGVLYCGLSKSSRLLTTTGLSLLGAVRKLAADNNQKGRWYYYPIAESKIPEHEAAIYILKLNEQSKRAFRFEIQGDQNKTQTHESLSNAFGSLATNSTDSTFPGYPYGLVDADDNARVTSSELEPYQVMMLSEISKLGSADKFIRHLESSDAHEILNRIRAVDSS